MVWSAWVFALAMVSVVSAQRPPESAGRVLQVLLVPSDGGTEDGTREDWEPLFGALSRHTGYTFELRVGQSYSAVIEALAAGRVDLAYLGTVAYLTARERGPVEVLAVGEMEGGAIYYSGLFARRDGPVQSVEALRGRTLALTDPASSSGFVYPLNILLKAGIDPARDLAGVRMTGSHVNSLNALQQGQVDVAAAPFESYLRSVRQGVIDPREIVILAKSDPIPNPPLVISSRLPVELRRELRETLHRLHELPGVTPDMLRGHAGRLVERYNAEVPESVFVLALENMARIDEPLKSALLTRAGERQRP